MSDSIAHDSAEHQHSDLDADPVVNRYASTSKWRDVDAYFTSELIIEDGALVEARESGVRTSMPNAEVAANQAALLSLITQISGAKRVLEFGTLAAYSTIWFARAVGEDGQVVTLEFDNNNAAISQQNLEKAGVADRTQILVGPAIDSVAQLIADGVEPFDLVFIDADKPSNPEYLAASLVLTKPGAVLIFDNVVRDGAVTDPHSDDPRVQGVRTAIRQIAEHPELDATAFQTVGEKGWDGMLIARRKEC